MKLKIRHKITNREYSATVNQEAKTVYVEGYATYYITFPRFIEDFTILGEVK